MRTIDSTTTFPISITTFFQMNGIILKVEKGMPIFQEGNLADQLYFIKNGAVQISKETESGKELAIRICREHRLIGEATVFCCSTFHTTTAKALMNTELYALSRERFENYLHTDSTIMADYIKWLQIEHMKDQSRLRDLVLHGKKGALYSTLIRLANTYGKLQSPDEVTIQLALTNSDLANLCATSREMINRMLSELRKQHVLDIEKGYITIHDLSFLKREIECEDCPLAVCRID